MARKLTTNDVISKIKEIHGELYDLTNLVYINKRTKIELKCKTHGSFTTSLDQVLRGQGCPTCGKSGAAEKRRVDFSSFVKKATQIHQNKYFYDELSYSKISAQVKIKCSEHGWFLQLADAHIRQKQGCPICGRDSQISKRKMSQEEFIEKSRILHVSIKYDYSYVKYKNNRTKVEVRCPLHGSFFPSPVNHLQGSGCPKCGVEKVHTEQLKDLDSFIYDSKKIHGSKYDYSKVKYAGGKKPVEIVCLKHGPFMQTPNAHSRGNGCPNCNTSKGEDKVKSILSNLEINYIQQHTFQHLIDKRKLKCDFFLPDFNLVIEFNGRQHYEPVNRFGGIKGLQETQRRDQLKRDYLKANKIELIEIHYLDKDIENTILSVLKFDLN